MDLIADRLTSQALSKPLNSVRDVVRRVVAVQAQSPWVPAHILRPRLAPGADMDMSGLRRTWLMRGTLHLVDAEDVAWLVDAFGTYFFLRQKPRREQLGLTTELFARVWPKLAAALPATREELVAIAEANGVPEGQARFYALVALCQTGKACMDAEDDVFRVLPKGDRPTFASRELGLRYLTGHGPASVDDLAAWAKKGRTAASSAHGQAEHLVDKIEAAEVPEVLLLGHFDPWLLGYEDRSFTLDPAHARQVQRGGGFLRPIVLHRGRVAGTWSYETRENRLAIEIDAWAPVPKDALEAEAAAVAASHGLELDLTP